MLGSALSSGLLMVTPASFTPAYRFGSFVLDAATGELRKGNTPLKLHPQPLRVLVLLVERAGGIVSREEIQRNLWGGHTWVDFDGGINFCIRQIRAVLSDDAGKPRYVETIARQGYRFIATVTYDGAPMVVIPISRGELTVTTTPTSGENGRAAEAATLPTTQVVAVTARRRSLIIAIVGIAALAIAPVWHFVVHRAPNLTQKDTVVVADFRNSTGDSVFDGTLQRGLFVQLQQSPYLNLVSEGQIQQTLRMMKQPPDTRLTPELAHEVCQRTNGTAVLEGSIAQIGTEYDLILKAVQCSTGDSLASTEVQASDKNHVLPALGEAAANLREKLGESLAMVQRYDRPLAQVTTSSLDALKAYSLGLSKYSQGDQTGALLFFQQAIALDPEFAMAYANLGRAYQVLGKGEPMTAALRKAYAMRDRASEREKFDIVAVYHQFVTLQIEETIANCELWEQSYPRDFTPHRILGFENGVLARYARSAEEFRKAIDLDSQQALPYAGLLIDLVALNRRQEARAVYEEAKNHHIEGGEVERQHFWIAFLDGDTEAMAKSAASVSSFPGYERKMLLEESSNASYLGRYRAAREAFQRAVDAALRDKDQKAAGGLESYMGVREALAGNLAEARRHATAAMKLGEEPALALALSGDAAQAITVTERLASQTLPGSYDAKMVLPELQGAIELQQGNATRALELFEPLAPYEEGWADRDMAGYLRGEAYLQRHRGQEAAAQFQKILDRPGIILNSEIGPLARVGLGRAYSMLGDKPKARAAYEGFFTLWKDADPDIPVLQEAKAEYAKLQ
jgi:DNA-binding winged helix-turn-helix (wHTH) protein/tetratricopeptide (TPR) repeat protein